MGILADLVQAFLSPSDPIESDPSPLKNDDPSWVRGSTIPFRDARTDPKEGDELTTEGRRLTVVSVFEGKVTFLSDELVPGEDITTESFEGDRLNRIECPIREWTWITATATPPGWQVRYGHVLGLRPTCPRETEGDPRDEATIRAMLAEATEWNLKLREQILASPAGRRFGSWNLMCLWNGWDFVNKKWVPPEQRKKKEETPRTTTSVRQEDRQVSISSDQLVSVLRNLGYRKVDAVDAVTRVWRTGSTIDSALPAALALLSPAIQKEK